MRRGLPHVLALLLALSTPLLAACGGGGTKDGIPSASAGDLKSQITDVAQAVDGDRCSEVEGQLRQVDEGIDQLPQTTDPRLVDALRDGADHLRQAAVEECESNEDTTTTETTPEQTETVEAPPEDEEPTEPTPTQTTEQPQETTPAEPPPPPEPTPPAPTPPAPQPPVAPPPPPVSPGGGVTPEVPPG